ncbi:uncharacterized protein LOC134227577 [Armigeres subalbatus]|uniref:uncharacterized protein LOC134227577 n=1 Tax=Armigeres subalbatus TaxID=124917 RepID=UPI002ED55DC9
MPDPWAAEVCQYKSALKRKAREGTERPEKIIRLCAADAPIEVQTALSKTAQRRICQRERGYNLPFDPEDPSKIDKEFTHTFDGRPFLLKNVEFDDGRIMLFSTSIHLEKLGESEVLIMDGTFSSAPANFKQIFTIHGVLKNLNGNVFVPLAYFLPANKKEATYEKAFKLLKRAAKELKIKIDPTVILTDFETAEINAVTSIFPDASKRGCNFHLAKNMWKHIQKLGLVSTYNKSIKCHMAFRQTEVLAFLQSQEVEQGLAAIRASSPISMKPFFDYFEKTYVLGKLKPNGRRGKPRFAPAFWSVAASTEDGLPRTSNAVEGWHNKFAGLFKDKTNFKFYEVLRAFQQEEKETSAKFLRNLQGDS